MLHNVRYLNIIIILVAAVMISALGIVVNHVGREKIIARIVSEKARGYAAYFQNSIWERYFPIINFITKTPDTDTAAIPAFLVFTNEMKELAELGRTHNIVLINNGKSIYSLKALAQGEVPQDIKTATNLLLKKPPFARDKYLYQYVYSPTLTDLPASYKQFADTIDATLLVYIDVTDSVSALKFLVIAVCLGVFLIIAFVALYYLFASLKAEKLFSTGQNLNISEEDRLKIREADIRSQFLSNISHELRTPLNAIIGFSEIIKSESMGPLDNVQYKEYIGDIHASGVHLLELIDDILDFSKAGESKLMMQIEEADLTKMVKMCVKMLSQMADERGVDIIDETGKEHQVIMADPVRLKQVILNILSNGIKFNKSGGQVILKFIMDDKFTTLEIKDNGVGMTPEDLETAQKPFGHIENNVVKFKSEGGTGLSLPLTKKLVELMNGKFDITSEVNLGTVIRISFEAVKGY